VDFLKYVSVLLRIFPLVLVECSLCVLHAVLLLLNDFVINLVLGFVNIIYLLSVGRVVARNSCPLGYFDSLFIHHKDRCISQAHIRLVILVVG